MAFTALSVALEVLRVMGDIGGLKRYFCKSCRRTFNDKTGTIFHYSRLSLRGWFMLMLLFLGLHNLGLGLRWLLDRSPMTVFRALRKLMLKLKDGRVEFRGAVEVDELYVNACLKGRNNSIRIKHLSREPRRRALGGVEGVHGAMISQQYSFPLVGGM